MRGAAALAAALIWWTSVMGRPRPLMVVVDAHSPIEDANRANELLDLATRAVGVPMYQLTTDGTHSLTVFDIDPAAVPSQVTPFAFEPPTYGFVSLTLNEAAEILRGNEAVRDGVILRTCRNRSQRDCGGAVHAAAVALLRDAESETAKKIRAVTELAASRRAESIVMVTAGWPYRDAGRVDMDRAVRDLKRRGTQLVVWHINSVVSYTGTVHNAAQEIASRLATPGRYLDSARAASQAREQLVGQRAEVAAAQPRLSSEPSVPRASSDRAASAPTVRDDPTFGRAQRYVAKFVQTFSAVMWREQSRQEDRVRQKFSASGTRFLTLRAKRDTVAEMLLLWLARESKWIAVRDVIAVDGAPLSDHDRPAAGVLNRTELSINDLRGLSTLNGRFNIGQIVHTFSEPTLALLFLTDREWHRFAFRRGQDEKVARRSARTYEYEELVRPTIVQDHDLDVPAQGRIWVDPDSGEVVQTLLELNDPASRLKGQMTVRYGSNPGFDVLVPLDMRELYSSAIGEEITTTATYSNFRRFETRVRIVGIP